MHRLFITLGLLLGLCGAGTHAAGAQPILHFKDVIVNRPTVELYFRVGCDGLPSWNMAKQDFRLSEDGIPVEEFTLWCPDPTIRCAISVALVFDASGNMSGAGNAAAKAAGRAFIDAMDGQIDEAAILWFDSQVDLRRHMTTLKSYLYTAVDSLPYSGTPAVWDGCYAGIQELISNGVNQCRAVILVSTGRDAVSTRTPADVISLANRNRIRVFTIGVGTSIDSTQLEVVATLTGGRYYAMPNAGQIAEMYEDISTITFHVGDCVITYENGCADGTMRNVELQLIDFCGGSVSQTRSYQAPLDSTTFSLIADGPLSFCEGDSVLLDAGGGYVAYLWSTGDTTRSITVRTAGRYCASVEDADGHVGLSNTLVVKPSPVPDKPVISRTGDLLSTGEALRYQWYLDGQPLPGDTIRFHRAVQTGVYQVAVTNEFGCTRISDSLIVTMLGIPVAALPQSPSLMVYPDPVHGTATLRLQLPSGGTGGIWLIDVLGHATRIGTLSGEPVRELTLDMSSRVSGVYHIVVLTGKDILTTKFMKR